MPFLWLQTQGLDTTDYLSGRIHALSVAGADNTLLISYIDETYTNAWGGYDEYDVNNLDTVLALQALNKINYQDQNTISSVLSFIISNQNPDGGFGLYQGDPSPGSGQAESNVYMTALVLQTLSQFKTAYDLNTPIANAVAYLLANQNADGGWGTAGIGTGGGTSGSTVYETALSLIALVNGNTGQGTAQPLQEAIQNAIAYLTATDLSPEKCATCNWSVGII